MAKAGGQQTEGQGMSTLFKPTNKELIPRTFEHAGGSLSLIARRPSYADYLADNFTEGAANVTARLAIINAWDGVNDAEGKPVPFSQENLTQLLSAYPALIAQVNKFTVELFNEAWTADAGKSEPPPPAG